MVVNTLREWRLACPRGNSISSSGTAKAWSNRRIAAQHTSPRPRRPAGAGRDMRRPDASEIRTALAPARRDEPVRRTRIHPETGAKLNGALVDSSDFRHLRASVSVARRRQGRDAAIAGSPSRINMRLQISEAKSRMLGNARATTLHLRRRPWRGARLADGVVVIHSASSTSSSSREGAPAIVERAPLGGKNATPGPCW